MVLSRALARLGVEIEVITGDHVRKVEVEKPFDGILVTRVPLKILPLPSKDGWIKYKVAPLMSWVLKKSNADLFHAHDYYHFSTDVAIHVAKKRNKPLVLTVHSRPSFFSISESIKKFYHKILGWKTLDYAAKVMFVAKTTMQEYIKLGLNPEKAVVIPPVVDVNELLNFKPPNGNFFSIRYDLKDRIYLICVGRIEKRKGFQHVIRILPELIKEVPELMLAIVGPDGGYLNYLKSLAKKLGIKDRVLFTGSLSENDLKWALLSANIFVLPSEDEGFPEVLLVAMGLGKPVIATNVGDVREILIPNENGLLIRKRQPEDLLKAILKLIFNRKFSCTLAENAQKTVASKYSVQKMAEKLMNVYSLLIS
jgi:glycosyltransferase involved in cell wall biosynthesis